MRFAFMGRKADCAECGWIAAEGAITLDTADKFIAFLAKEGLDGRRLRVELHSDGGSLIGAMKFGRVIREKGLPTKVARSRITFDDPTLNLPSGSLSGARCLSACAFAFLGGVSRVMDTEAVLGLSRFTSETAFLKPAERLFNVLELPLERIMEGILLEYVVSMGIDTRIVEIAASTAPGEIRALEPQELGSLGIVLDQEALAPRRTVNDDDMSPWRIEPHRQGIVAYSRSQDGQTQVTLYCTTPRRRRPYARYVRIKSEKADMRARTTAFLNTARGRTAFGRTLTRWSVSLDPDENGAIRIALPGDLNFDRISEETLIGMETPASAEALSIRLPASGLGEAARVVFRNCVS